MGQNQTAPRFSLESGGSITTSYVLLTLNAAHEIGGEEVPSKRVHAGVLVIPIKGISGLTSLTVKVTRDANGDEAVTEEVTKTVVTGQTTATSGTVALTLNTMLWTDGAAFYVWVKSDAGTATVGQAWLTWRRA